MLTPAEYERTELSLRQACERRDYQSATTIVVESYGGELLAFLVARLRDRSSGEEVLATVFENLWVGLPSFEWQCPLRAWAYRLARNAANDYAKAVPNQAARRVTFSQHPSQHPVEPSRRTTTAPYRRTETKDRVRELRTRLSDDDQMLLVLRVDRGMSFRDLAVAFGECQLDEDELSRQSARLRKRFERIKADVQAQSPRLV